MKIYRVYAKPDEKRYEHVVGYVKAENRIDAYVTANKLFDNVLYLDFGKEAEEIDKLS